MIIIYVKGGKRWGQEKRVNSQMKRDEEIKGGILLTEFSTPLKSGGTAKNETKKKKKKGRKKVSDDSTRKTTFSCLF